MNGIGQAQLLRGEGRLMTIGASDGVVSLWSAHDGKLLAQLRHSGDLTKFQTTKAEDRLICLTKKDLRIWNLANGSPVGLPIEHSEGARFFLSQDEEMVYLLSGNGVLSIYDTSDAGLIVRYPSWDGEVDFATVEESAESAVLFTVRAWAPRSFVVSAARLPQLDLAGERPRLRLECRTGTTMDEFGNMRFLSLEEWRERRHQYGDQWSVALGKGMQLDFSPVEAEVSPEKLDGEK